MNDPTRETDAETEQGAAVSTDETDIKEMLGLFDSPAFARRGRDLEEFLERLNARCDRERSERLEMVRLRLRQWSAAATGPEDWPDTFAEPIAPLWDRCGLEPGPWAERSAPPRRRKAVAAALVASVERFNRRWVAYLEQLDLEPINRRIDQYNRYYLLEKECVMGSHRLAARTFRPIEPLSVAALLRRHPTLPLPIPVGRTALNRDPNPYHSADPSDRPNPRRS